MLLWLKDLMNVTVKLQSIEPIFRHSSIVPSLRQVISEKIKGPLVSATRSPLMKALDGSVETLGLWIVTLGYIHKSLNQDSIKPCLKKYVSARNSHFLKLSWLTNECIFCFVLSLLISRVAKVKYRNDSIWRPGAYLLLVPQKLPLIRKRALIYFLRKCRWLFLYWGFNWEFQGRWACYHWN